MCKVKLDKTFSGELVKYDKIELLNDNYSKDANRGFINFEVTFIPK